MIKKLFILLILIVITGYNQNVNRDTTNVSNSAVLVTVNKSAMIPITRSLPFGSMLMALTKADFPQEWVTQSGPKNIAEFIDTLLYDTLNCFWFIDSHSNERCYNSKLNGFKNIYREKDIKVDYYDDMYHVFKNDFPMDDYLIPFASFLLPNDFDLILFTAACELGQENEKYDYGESGFYGYTRIDAIIFKYGNVHDVLNIHNSTYFRFGGTNKLFYIDSDVIIHLKHFEMDEIYTRFIRYEKYQISPQGMFVRYYDSDGEFSNDEERGLVINNVREGKWIEMKPNGYILSRHPRRSNCRFNDNFTWLESEYEGGGGVPVGKSRFYRLEQECDEEGWPILSSRRKGELLYTETYEDGRMVRREFVRE